MQLRNTNVNTHRGNPMNLRSRRPRTDQVASLVRRNTPLHIDVHEKQYEFRNIWSNTSEEVDAVFPQPYNKYSIEQLDRIVRTLQSQNNQIGAELWRRYKQSVELYLSRLNQPSHLSHRFGGTIIPKEPLAIQYAHGFTSRVKDAKYQGIRF